MIRERKFEPFLFGDKEILVSHPVGTEENYGAILTQRKSIFGYEPSLSHIVSKNVSAGDLFLDVGAQIGLFAIQAALLQAEVVSFEMRPSVAHCHFETKAKNGITNWLPLAYAVGESVSQIPIADEAQFALLKGASKAMEPEGYVTCMPIDMLNLHETHRNRPTFVKIDIEGFEVFALRGMKAFTTTLRPIMAIECHPHGAWAYGASIQEIRSLLPENYTIQFVKTHRNESEVGDLELVTAELPVIDNYLIMAAPAERPVKF